MTTATRHEALCVGYERLLAWAEVLDRINIFPVPDGDTGRNLVVSLAPLRDTSSEDERTIERLLLSARGNSGNIAVEFVRKLLDPTVEADLAVRFARGAAAARRAVCDPQPGTMLTTLDALAAAAAAGLDAGRVERVLGQMTEAVQATAHGLPVLRAAGVVDSGSLGMLLFVDGFLRSTFGVETTRPLADEFRHLSRFSRTDSVAEGGWCIDVVLRPREGTSPAPEAIRAIGHDVVTLREGDLLKVHLHTDDAAVARRAFETLGEIVRWYGDDLREQTSSAPLVSPEGAVHVVTDGAASLSRRDAEALGVTVLDSYVTIGDVSLPETLLSPEDVYAAMRKGSPVTTSRASTFEQHQHYERLAGQYEHVLYLCVGSAYTGNVGVASAWVAERAVGGRVAVLDSGAASGRLAVVVRAVARKAQAGAALTELVAFAKASLERAEEYVFLEKLEYLARGGRVGKGSAVFADLLGIAPVVTPMPDGVHRLAVLSRREDKAAYACERLARALARTDGRGIVLLLFTDNRDWVQGELSSRVRALLPHAECHSGPMSLTSGAHMGPGTWSAAVLAAEVAVP